MMSPAEQTRWELAAILRNLLVACRWPSPAYSPVTNEMYFMTCFPGAASLIDGAVVPSVRCRARLAGSSRPETIASCG